MASESDQEYIPSDLDEEAFLNHTYGTDEEAYLQGATTGELAHLHVDSSPGCFLTHLPSACV